VHLFFKSALFFRRQFLYSFGMCPCPLPMVQIQSTLKFNYIFENVLKYPFWLFLFLWWWAVIFYFHMIALVLDAMVDKHSVRLHSWSYMWPFCPPYWFLNEVINKRHSTCHKCTHWPWKPYPRHQNECPILYRTRDIGHFRDCKNGCRIFGHNFFSTSNFCVDFFFCVPYNI